MVRDPAGPGKKGGVAASPASIGGWWSVRRVAPVARVLWLREPRGGVPVFQQLLLLGVVVAGEAVVKGDARFARNVR